ncbi:Mov34/MPN/PAD-1 family protein [Sorangium sp. So ce362]|uniref:Mov34/MPN/PAD-1 family protein n=1 Tax=Sorangium sp. So ce362 TaxID=3133303 RepID=UPI003F61851C
MSSEPSRPIGPRERPPHPATVAQPKPAPSGATTRPPHPSTAVQPKAPHPATVVQGKGLPPHRATVIPPQSPSKGGVPRLTHPAIVVQQRLARSAAQARIPEAVRVAQRAAALVLQHGFNNAVLAAAYGGAAAKTANDALGDSKVRDALKEAWMLSINLKGKTVQERGGWIFFKVGGASHEYKVVLASTKRSNALKDNDRATGAAIDLADPGSYSGEVAPDGYAMIANFHSHPLTHGNATPSQADIQNAYVRNLQGIVLSCDGHVYIYGPLRLASTRVGYPMGGAVAAAAGPVLAGIPASPWNINVNTGTIS